MDQADENSQAQASCHSNPFPICSRQSVFQKLICFLFKLIFLSIQFLYITYPLLIVKQMNILVREYRCSRRKENPRHISKQLRSIEQFLDSENPDKSLVAQVMKECCQKYRYQFSQFKVVYSLAKAGRELATDDCRAQVPSGSVSYTDLSVYAKAFQERTERKEAAAR